MKRGQHLGRTKLDEGHRQVLEAMAQGHFLRSHRDLEGRKTYLLHPLEGPPIPVAPALVERLCELGLIDSNKKFPVATYWLTAKARQWLSVEPAGVHSTS
ncbi:MAG: hypothetical protein RML36_05740 [Anaerolineae bacterium]|nr:hypothetical protein [Anaerolineae bacterium]MDW8098970.1 hypothetical protein [Anaerolineae bacterium]